MFYPINLKIDDMKIVIIGGGKVAYRKCMNFLAFNKKVLVGIVVTRYSYNIRIDVFKSLDIKKVINLSIYIHIDAYMLTKLLGKFTEYFDFWSTSGI